MTTPKTHHEKSLCYLCIILLLATILSPLGFHYDPIDKQMKPKRCITYILSLVYPIVYFLPSDTKTTDSETCLASDKRFDEIDAAIASLQNELLSSGDANKEETEGKLKILRENISALRNEMTGLPGRQKASAAKKDESGSYRLKVDPLDKLLLSEEDEKPFSIEFTKPKDDGFSVFKNFDATMFIIVYVLTITFFTILTVVSIKGLRRQEQRDLYERGKKEFWLMLKTSSNREPYQEQFMQEMMRLYFNKKDE